jgi:hypothetical protein
LPLQLNHKNEKKQKNTGVQQPFFHWRKFTKKKNSNEVILEVLTTKSDGKIS